MPRRDRPRVSELPGLIVATLMMQRVRLRVVKKAKPPDDRRWAVSCEVLWKGVDTGSGVGILGGMH